MKRIQFIIFIAFLTATVALYAQQSQETRDAIQDQRLVEVERQASHNAGDIKDLIVQLTGLRGSVDRFTGIGIGFGAALTALQGLQLLVQVKASSTKKPS